MNKRLILERMISSIERQCGSVSNFLTNQLFKFKRLKKAGRTKSSLKGIEEGKKIYFIVLIEEF